MEGTTEDKKGKLSFFQFLNVLRWVLVYNIKLAPAAAIFGALIEIFLTISPLLNAYIFGRLLDRIIQIASTGSSPTDIIPMLLILLAYNLFSSAVRSVNVYLSNIMSYATDYTSSQLLYRQIYSLGIQTLENPDVVNRVQRSREIFSALNSDFDRSVAFVARIVTLAISGLIIVKTMPLIVGIIAFSMLPELICNRFYMRKGWKLYRDETENRRRAGFVFGSLTETSNLHEITITSAYNYLARFYKRFADRYTKENLKIDKAWQSFGFLFGSITDIASMFGYFTILKNLFDKLISVGAVTFQMRSLDSFVNSFSAVANSYVSLYERCLRVSEVKEVFDMKPMIADGSLVMPRSDEPPRIVLNAVNFRYPNSDRLVIQNLNLDIKPGEKIAIVGENGAGKTTLVKLLCRFYKVSEGNIYLNDENINDIQIESWYKNLGVLFQDYNTYSALTLKENILLGNSEKELNKEQMELAAKKANVSSFMETYKNGFDQVLSEKFKGGIRPSTGQWQKIAIARFFYRNSPVLIFDEPTASIDAVSEAEIFGQIYAFFEKKTVIIISHRFSTVRNADKIYVLDNGAIIESGNHKELMKLKGKYHHAFTIQAKGYK